MILTSKRHCRLRRQADPSRCGDLRLPKDRSLTCLCRCGKVRKTPWSVRLEVRGFVKHQPAAVRDQKAARQPERLRLVFLFG